MCKRAKKLEKSEETRSWSSQNPLSDALSEPPTHQTFQQSSPWIEPTWRVKIQFGDAANEMMTR